MIRKSAPGIILFILSFVFTTNSNAQPQLPDIAGTMQQGVIVLTWDCQYDGIKSIAIQRSGDSIYNFATVGYVRNIKKGLQAFVDGHPSPGNNWYQLYIVFGSGLTWNSNRLKLHVDSSTLENQTVVLPPNDSLQKMLITSDPSADIIKSKKSGIIVRIDSSNNSNKANAPEVDISSITRKESNSFPEAMTTKVTTVTTTSSSSSAENTHHITISIDTAPSDVNPYTYVKSRYIFTNPLTGHVDLEVPDVKQHRYSVKFFDDKNNVVVDVPRITVSPVVIDKRNFEHKGIYKFELRRDGSQFETGYVTIY